MISLDLGDNLRELKQAVTSLVRQAGLSGTVQLHSILEGANNRVFRVEANGAAALLKVYFHHRQDLRDRLGAEFKFSTFAWNQGLRSLPQPLLCDSEHHLALYEYVEGRRLAPGEVTEERVQEALNFYLEINRYKHLPEAQALPQASEACFTLAQHLQCVAGRLDRLQQIDSTGLSHREALSFVRDQLMPAWERVDLMVKRRSTALGLPLDQELQPHERCLSPSDFGFHNAILTNGGGLRFIDFEYAGWDDPAKLVCDFFCQPAVPVPMEYFERFAAATMANLAEPELHLKRAALILAVYRCKWCCILLNNFLPVSGERRKFAKSDALQEEQKQLQLQKAHRALSELLEGGEL